MDKLFFKKACLVPHFVAALVIALSMPGRAEELRHLNWSDYTPEDVISGFEHEFGVSVIHDVYSESDDAETVLHTGNSGYDVAVVSLEVVDRLRLGDAVARIDDDHLSNAAGVDSAFMERFYQRHPSTRGYIQPFLWGYTVLAFDRAKVTARIPDASFDSWALLFDPENAARLADCGIYVVNFPEEVIAIALAYLGRNPISQEPQDVDDAFEVISAIAPYIQDIESEHYDVLTAGDACLALTWNTEVTGVIVDEGRAELGFVAPAEGTNVWLDAMVIPSDAPDPDLARVFVDYLLRPDISARLANYNYTPSAVPATQSLMKPLATDNPMILPPDEDVDSWFITQSFSPEAKADINRRWWRLFLGI